MENLHSHIISNVSLQSGKQFSEIEVSYQLFGQELGSAPVVLVNHALTGNSNVSGEKGWWNSLVGENQVISLQRFTVICFNIPGNGFGENPQLFKEEYQAFSTTDIAFLFWKTLKKIGVEELFAIIGGSLGGGISWEMCFLKPTQVQHLIPIASSWKANDWLVANILVQDHILNNSSQPVHDARLHAMLLYRTPQSLQYKFEGKKEGNAFQVESWLLHHGKILTARFELASYKLMNHLLKTIGVSKNEEDLISFAKNTKASICQIGINSDYFFIPEENKKAHEVLVASGASATYYEIESIHGHDAFLIEFEQLNNILKPIFGSTKYTTQQPFANYAGH